MINGMIFLAGLVIYAGYGMPGLAFLLAATSASYLMGLLISRHRWLVWVSIALNAGFLLAIKLRPITGWELLAPMGASYFLLRVISYNVDIYRGKYAPEQSFLRYSLYVTYLPNLFLGPIERCDRFLKAAYDDRRITWDGISMGAARILWGGFKKLAIATRAGVIVGTVSAAPEKYRGAYALLAMLLYSVQLYADFSGGIDMVLGVSQMLGISQSENFNSPYFSQSFQEFWRRWHMTLGGWLREYVYIPLGGNRKGKFRKYLNSIITFLVSGLWHGIHYLLWGLINGIFVSLGEKFKTRWKLLNRAGTFLLVTLLWCFFIWPDTMTAVKLVASVFTTFNYSVLASGILELGLNAGEWIVLLVSAAALWVYDWKRDVIRKKYLELRPAGRVAICCTLGLIILIFGMYGIGFNAEEFIYSNF